jgi:hypothetical protein
MIIKLDDLIHELQEKRVRYGNCDIGIHDADTGWHLKIYRVREPTRHPGRLLIEGNYDNMFKPK